MFRNFKWYRRLHGGLWYKLRDRRKKKTFWTQDVTEMNPRHIDFKAAEEFKNFSQTFTTEEKHENRLYCL